MKHLQFLYIAFFIFNSAHGQPSMIDTAIASVNLRSSAEKMGQLFIEKNYTLYIKYIHPDILKMAGGGAKMTELLKKSLNEIEAEGLTFDNVSIGSPSTIIITKSGLQSVVPQILELKTKDGRLKATSYLVGISGDKGKTWYFMDTSGKTLVQMQVVFPFLSNDLVIPEKKPPVFLND
ncbi:MAG: hypothetical protein ABI472_04775 [Ginsengibacter sp.]